MEFYKYFSDVKEKINEIKPLIKSELTDFDVISDDMGIIKGRVVFIDGSVIDFRELLSKEEHDYRFHWMDRNNRVISRWDSAPHYRDLKTFPFHVHTPEGVEECREINLIAVFDLIKKRLLSRIKPWS